MEKITSNIRHKYIDFFIGISFLVEEISSLFPSMLMPEEQRQIDSRQAKVRPQKLERNAAFIDQTGSGLETD
jgi:hypothetical protein